MGGAKTTTTTTTKHNYRLTRRVMLLTSPLPVVVGEGTTYLLVKADGSPAES